MLDIQSLTEKFPLEQLKAEKESLEKELSEAYTGSGDVSVLSAKLSYTTNLFQKYEDLNKQLTDLQENYQIIDGDDNELAQIAQEEIPSLEKKVSTLITEINNIEMEHELEDPDDSRSVVMEIRAGAGGDEASLFGADLYRMYVNFAGKNGWEVEMIDSSISESGGYKEVIAFIKGDHVYEKLKYESGVHRVQRIPTTESSGRIHTSTASVAIMPEAQDIELDLKPEDLRVDTMRSSGAGGQSVNKTSSAVRITHIPTGIVVSCQDTKVQQQNKEKAMQILRARLYEKEKQEQMAKRSEMRSSQIGSAMRAEKIRTYNYPQSRITDHRVKKSWHNLEAVMDGSIEDMIDEIDTEIKKMRIEAIRKEREAG